MLRFPFVRYYTFFLALMWGMAVTVASAFGQGQYQYPRQPQIQSQQIPNRQVQSPQGQNRQIQSPQGQNRQVQSRQYNSPQAQSSGHNQSQEQTAVRIGRPLAPATDALRAKDNARVAIAQMKITPQDMSKVQYVLQKTSIYRRLPIFDVDCDAEMMKFLINYPDVIVNLWEKMGISQIVVRESVPNYYQVEDVAGTKGYLQYVGRAENAVLCYIEGLYDGKMLPKPIHGRGLVLVRFTTDRKKIPTPDGKFEPGPEQVRCYVDAFLTFDQDVVDLISRILLPMLGKIADNNLEQTLAFVNWYSEYCQKNPYNITMLSSQMFGLKSEVRLGMSRTAWNTACRNGYFTEDDRQQFDRVCQMTANWTPENTPEITEQAVPAVAPASGPVAGSVSGSVSGPVAGGYATPQEPNPYSNPYANPYAD